MNDLRSGVCFLLRRGSNTVSSFLKARDKQPQYGYLLVSMISQGSLLGYSTIKNYAIRGTNVGWGSVARDNLQVEGVELIRCVNGCVTSLETGPAYAMKYN